MSDLSISKSPVDYWEIQLYSCPYLSKGEEALLGSQKNHIPRITGYLVACTRLQVTSSTPYFKVGWRGNAARGNPCKVPSRWVLVGEVHQRGSAVPNPGVSNTRLVWRVRVLPGLPVHGCTKRDMPAAGSTRARKVTPITKEVLFFCDRVNLNRVEFTFLRLHNSPPQLKKSRPLYGKPPAILVRHIPLSPTFSLLLQTLWLLYTRGEVLNGLCCVICCLLQLFH